MNIFILEKEKESDQRIASLEYEIAKPREEIKSQSAAKQKLPDKPVIRPLTESTTGLEKPTVYKHPTEAKKPKAKKRRKMTLANQLRELPVAVLTIWLSLKSETQSHHYLPVNQS